MASRLAALLFAWWCTFVVVAAHGVAQPPQQESAAPQAATAQQEPPPPSAPLTFLQLLQRLVDVDWLWRAPLPGERCVQWSSYDRKSHQGPGDAGAWYANDDRGQHLRVVERNGAKEHVMVDATGPGCIARIWSANPNGTLHFDVDGDRVWSVDFAALCSGKVDGVPEPLAGMRSRGGNVYLPIPFQRSLVVSCTAGDCYYAFDVALWPPTQPVEPFRTALLATHREAVQHLCRDFPRATPPYNTTLFVPSRRVVVKPRTLVRWFEITLPEALTTGDAAEVLRHSLLVVRCGDEETVRVPLTAFFAAGPDWLPHEGRFLKVKPRGGLSAWPMPMPAGGSIEIVSEPDVGPLAPELGLLETEPLTDPSPLLFRASYHLKKGTKTRPFSDHLVLDAKGHGRFVGCSLLVRNPSRIWWGEGDEKFVVDGEAFPSWFGTGTEDYFGYAWCDPTPFQAPFHAQVCCQGPMNFGFTQLHRTHLLDSVPFQRSFRFELERWHWVPDTTIDYETVAYWYGAASATAGLPAVPPAAERQLERLATPPMFIAEGALEGEALPVLRCSGGSHEVQDLSVFERVFSRDAQRWWRDGKVGDVLELGLPVDRPGRYRITATFARADDFGIVQAFLGEQALGAPIDGYAERVSSSGPLLLGECDLPVGPAVLRLQLTGKNPAAKPRMMVGLDSLRLEKLP